MNLCVKNVASRLCDNARRDTKGRPVPKPGDIQLSASHFGHSVGYGLFCCWATVSLFSGSLGILPPTAVTTYSMLSGAIACLGALALYGRMAPFSGRSARAFGCAAAVAIGTFLYSYPALAESRSIGTAGTILSGTFAILVLMSWFDVFARMPPRTIVIWAGAALPIGAVASVGITALPAGTASIAISAMPLVSWALLPSPKTQIMQAGRTARDYRDFHGSHGPVEAVREAVPSRTLLGIVIVFFVIGALGVSLEESGRFVRTFDPAYLLIPLLGSAFFVASAHIVRKAIDTSTLYKVLMIAIAALAFTLANVLHISLSLLYFTYIMAEVVLWTVLCIAARSTPVQAYAVFAVGWLAEALGNVLGHNAAAAIADPALLSGIIIVLIIIAVGFAFGDGTFVINVDESGETSNDAPECIRSDNPSTKTSVGRAEHGTTMGIGAEARGSEVVSGDQDRTNRPKNIAAEASFAQPRAIPQEAAATYGPDPIARFVDAYGLSRRERDVFELWVTGHGLKHIENALYISEATVKSHLRNIYRKCDTHSRAEIIDLYESMPEPR